VRRVRRWKTTQRLMQITGEKREIRWPHAKILISPISLLVGGNCRETSVNSFHPSKQKLTEIHFFCSDREEGRFATHSNSMVARTHDETRWLWKTRLANSRLMLVAIRHRRKDRIFHLLFLWELLGSESQNEVFQQKVWTKTNPRHLWFRKYELFDLPAILTLDPLVESFSKKFYTFFVPFNKC